MHSPQWGEAVPTSPGRTLLSRLKSPFSSKTRNLSEFYIRLNDPHRNYFPGEQVKGTVVVTVVKPVRITHLVVTLHGYVRVFKNAHAPGEGLGNDTGGLASIKAKKHGDYQGPGFASLFEDELTLCGEGRLDVGIYEFNFELEFPTKDVPSSIDFERGTISYSVTSTLTRPTSISPTVTCDRKVYLVETVDVGPLYHPKPRIITLEPISRRSRARKSSRARGTKKPSSKIDNLTVQDSQSSTTNGLSRRTSQDSPRSPAPSEVSSESTVSNSTSTGSYMVGSGFLSRRSDRNSDTKSYTTAIADQTITATIELEKAGCLPGDLLPLRVSVNHTKPVKSLHGVIITLYRQGRIDAHAILPTGKGKSIEIDYLPKSRSGLGGLSFSSAGSSSIYRKDIAQTTAPLMVDPKTLNANVKTSIRVPDDAFPTICGVPGDMISFKYYIEVVLDLGGRLARRDRYVSTFNVPTVYNNSRGEFEKAGESFGGLTSNWEGHIVDTDPLRREKSVVACLFQVVIGTTDSERRRTRRLEKLRCDDDWSPTTGDEAQLTNEDDEQHHDQDYSNEDDYYAPHAEDLYSYDGRGDHYLEQRPAHELFPTIPPPDLPSEDSLDEKTRLRLAEERLLPSQPPVDPVDEDPSSSASAPLEPSAPILTSDLDPSGGETPTPTAPPLDAFTNHHNASSSTTHPLPPHDHDPPLPLPPPALALPSLPTDDKHELERRRLQAEASAPDDFPDDDEDDMRAGGEHAEGDGGDSPNRESASGMEVAVPSAPVLSEDDELGLAGHDGEGYGHGEGLPRYER